MREIRILLLNISLFWILTSCGGILNSAPSAIPSTPAFVSPTQSPSPTMQQDALPTTPPANNTPTDTLPGQTAAPTGLNATGPYAVFEGEHGIWIVHPDGGLPTRIAEQGVSPGMDLRAALSPDGDRIALAAEGKTGIDLLLIGIPGGQTKILSRLLDVTRVERTLNSLSPKAFAYYAITDFPNLAWQPGEGGILAYVGAEKGPTADMYTYDRTWDKTRQLETNSSQAINPIWSPDGEYLLFSGVNWLPPFGPTYVTFDPMAGFWAVRVSDNQIIPQPALEGTYRNFLGWKDDTHYLVYDSDKECAARNLRAVEVTTGEISPIADYCLSSRPAWSGANGAILLSADAGCKCSIGEGVFLILPGSSEPVRLLEQPAFELYWLPESGMFYAYPEALFSADGGTRYDPPVIGSSYHPAISKNGRQAWEIIEGQKSRLAIRLPGGEWQTKLEGSIGAMMWDPATGDTLLIALENGELYAATAPDFSPRLVGNLIGPINQAVWIQ